MSSAVSAAPAQILTFHLDQQLFGVDILRVREIRGWTPVTPVPETPPHVLGVLNLRGAIVPVIDLRTRLGLPAVAGTATTVIVVLTVVGSQGRRDFGLVVDAVSDVSHLNQNDVQPTPSGITLGDRNSVPALATLGERMILLLDIDGMLAADEGVALAA
ncbi:chemotaxis protein CheW [Steroidobacter agaridevorans]|uniref:Chemotaxis protein CheW n=1 Tax=Steroidobacter agaridevorans TaxID=2695856 RepID=A0A829YJI6_9GAMM|nr:chemotaxis protein CheW [Steroidobacter agaridevorans]GFE82676.1 chemotaxis protein CheW [Steroidobacter agaridevorans]GFE85763.1 chemotaxis protein CheW [Steroidobacter agaridevorans]